MKRSTSTYQPPTPVDSPPATEREYSEYVKSVLKVFLKECHERGVTAKYEELSKLAGFSVVTPKGRYYLNCAKTRLQFEEGMAFLTVTNIGLKPIPTGKMATKFGQDATQKIGSATTQFRENLSSVPLPKLKGVELEAYITEALRCSYYEHAHQSAEGSVRAAEEERCQKLKANEANIQRMIKAGQDIMFKRN